MNLKITEQKENLLLGRKEVHAQLDYDTATPAKEELRQQLSKSMKVDAELLIIKHIYPSVGNKSAAVLIYQYHDKQQMQRIEGVKKATKPKAEKQAKEKAE